MEKTMTLRIYKDEYKANQLAYLSKKFKVVEETGKILTISGTVEDLDKVMNSMFSTDEQFKELFPTFLTEKERIRFSREKYQEAKDVIQEKLLQIISYGVVGEEFNKLYSIYKTM